MIVFMNTPVALYNVHKFHKKSQNPNEAQVQWTHNKHEKHFLIISHGVQFDCNGIQFYYEIIVCALHPLLGN